MNDLNYHHLYYFWIVAREGSIAAARDKLHVTQPTISVQLTALEEALGQPLFDRRGRRLYLTEVGEVVYRYASDIFALGKELVSSVERGGVEGRTRRFAVGVADVVPKLVASRVLGSVDDMEPAVLMSCYEGKPADLLARLALHELDLVLSDQPVGPGSNIRAYNHVLGRSGVTFLAPGAMARRYRSGFPESLDGAPLLAPTPNTALRYALDEWFDKLGIRPAIVAEFEDSALLKAYSEQAEAIFPVSTVIAASAQSHYGGRSVGATEEVVDTVYAISTERKLKHPAVVTVVDAARETLFD